MMQKIIKNIVLSLLVVATSTSLFGQRDLTLYNMGNMSQAMSVNPAYRPKTSVFVTLPLGMQTIGFTNSGFGAADLFTPSQTSFVTDDSFFKSMRSINSLQLQMRNEVFGFGFRVKKNYFTFNVSNKFDLEFDYTPDFLQLLIQGNGGGLAGRRASFDGLGIHVSDYTEYALGYNREVNEKLVVGGKIKLLSGLANVNTAKSTLGFTTGINGTSVGFDGSAFIRSSNLGVALDTTKQTKFPVESAFNFSNLGLALDLGVTYKVAEKVTLSASIIDLGYISWKNDVKNYELKKFEYTFNGVDASSVLTDTTDVFKKISDTLTNMFKTEQSNTAYSTTLATRFYVGGTYHLNKYFNAGVLWYSQFVRNQYRPAVVLSTTVNVRSWLSASVNYGMYAKSYSNLGFGLSLRGGPLQLYVLTDNILAPFNLGGTRTASLSVGLNLVFGKGKDRVKKSKDEPAKTSEKTDTKTDTKTTKSEETSTTPATPLTPAPSEPLTPAPTEPAK
jgi:hypothetical protein